VRKQRLILDTNVIAYFFEGNKQAGKIVNLNDIVISAIILIETLSSKKIPTDKREVMEGFLQALTVIESNPQINKIAIGFRLKYSLDTPDAIIAATAKYLDLPLVTADKVFFKIKEIEIIPFTK
jgi:predicted nucleic acid-binding protein